MEIAERADFAVWVKPVHKQRLVLEVFLQRSEKSSHGYFRSFRPPSLICP